MSSTVLKRRLGVSRCHAVGFSGSRSYLSQRFEAIFGADEGERFEVQIRWKPVLQAVVAFLGGTEPIYRREDTGDAMFQMSVSFNLMSDKNGLNQMTMRATGNKCFSLCEAESEASAAALQRFEGGMFRTKVMDISKLVCMEMKEKCHHLLMKTGNLQRVLDMLLSDWSNGMGHIEYTSVTLVRKITGSFCHDSDDTFSQINLNIAEQVAAINTKSQQRHRTLADESKVFKREQWKARTELKNIFNETLVPKVQRFQGGVPAEIKISMMIILSEMMISLGWAEPLFNVIWRSEKQEYICEVELQPKGNNVYPNVRNMTVEGAGQSCEKEAKESAATTAILYLEKQSAICLIDINYNRRSHVETYLSEVEKLRHLTFSLLKNVFSGWEEVVEEVRACDKYCRSMVTNYGAIDRLGEEYNVKWECAESIAELLQLCTFELQLGQHQLMAIESSMEKS